MIVVAFVLAYIVIGIAVAAIATRVSETAAQLVREDPESSGLMLLFWPILALMMICAAIVGTASALVVAFTFFIRRKDGDGS